MMSSSLNTRRRSLDSDISWNLCSVLLSPTCQPIPYRFINQVNLRKILILRYRSPTSPLRPLRRSYMISSREYILSSSPPFWLIDKQILWPVSPETYLVFFFWFGESSIAVIDHEEKSTTANIRFEKASAAKTALMVIWIFLSSFRLPFISSVEWRNPGWRYIIGDIWYCQRGRTSSSNHNTLR